MGRAVDLFVTYRFIKLLTTPFKKTDAYKLGIIDENGHRVMKQVTRSKKEPAVPLNNDETKNAYTILHKLIFNIKKLFVTNAPVKYVVNDGWNKIIKDFIDETKELGSVSKMQISPEQGKFLEIITSISNAKQCLEMV